MNEIYNFRKDRIIPKALYGIKTSEPIEEIIGDWVRENNRSLFGSGMRWYNRNNPVGRLAAALEKEIKVKDADGKEWILKPDGSKVSAAARRVNARAAGRVATDKLDQPFDGYYVFKPDYDPNNSTISQETPLLKNTNQDQKKVTLRKSNYTAKATPKGQAYWDSQYQNFLSQMTNELKKWLKLRGIDHTSAKEMQTYLNNLGLDIGKLGVDNKWGKASQAAWDNFVATTMKNNPLQTPVEDQPVIDAPDPFGYKTSNTYEDNDFANKLKGMGIRSNADLINFMHNSAKEGWKGNAWQIQFRSDVDKALGGDYSDANIRKTFNTKNDWGRGFLGGGDFSDFQNALQTNAGVWNGAYELRQNNARMDAARQQLANKLAQQYAIPLLSKLNVSLKKPIIGNTGTNTMGTIPTITPKEGTWMDYAALHNYLPKPEEIQEENPYLAQSNLKYGFLSQ